MFEKHDMTFTFLVPPPFNTWVEIISVVKIQIPTKINMVNTKTYDFLSFFALENIHRCYYSDNM